MKFTFKMLLVIGYLLFVIRDNIILLTNFFEF